MAKQKQPAKKEGKVDLVKKAYMGIRRMLFYNEITPGQKISYSDLAERIGVSTTPVISALKFLEFKAIVRHEPNKGYYANEISLKEVKEIYQTRELIEVSLIPEIFRNKTGEGIAKVRAALEAHSAAVAAADLNGRLLTDMKFHLNLAALSQSRVQVRILQELYDLLYLKYSRSLLFVSILDTSESHHRRILSRLEAGEEEATRRALSDHLSDVKKSVLKGMEKIIACERQPVSDFAFPSPDMDI